MRVNEQVEKFIEVGFPIYEKPDIWSFLNWLKEFILDTDKEKLIYIMPQRVGDVFLSTGVIKGLKEIYPEHEIYFCTKKEYFPVFEGNPDVDVLIPYNDEFINKRGFLSYFFDANVYIPSYLTQIVGEWTHPKQHQSLGESYARFCNVKFHRPFIDTKEVEGLPEKYICLHALKPYTDNTAARSWKKENWAKLVEELSKILPVVQVGTVADDLVGGAIDFRGKTYQESAFIIKNSEIFVGWDSFPAHMAALFQVPAVVAYNNTYPSATGSECLYEDKTKFIPITPPKRREGCEYPCHKLICYISPMDSCSNEITPEMFIEEVKKWLKQ